MKNLEIRIIGGEVFVPLYAVVELLKQANPLAVATQAAIKQQAQCLPAQDNGYLGRIGGAIHPPCGDNFGIATSRAPSLSDHEEGDYRGLRR